MQVSEKSEHHVCLVMQVTICQAINIDDNRRLSRCFEVVRGLMNASRCEKELIVSSAKNPSWLMTRRAADSESRLFLKLATPADVFILLCTQRTIVGLSTPKRPGVNIECSSHTHTKKLEEQRGKIARHEVDVDNLVKALLCIL